jgi:hypothetical protein
MADACFWLLCGSGLTWIAMSLRRGDHWREFGARRRGSNPPPPGRKPAPPAGPRVKPQFPPPREIIEDFLPRRPTGEYQPRRSSRTVNPPLPKQ